MKDMSTKKTKDFRHRIPSSLKAVLEKHKDLKEIWATLTPLAQNEWMCFVTTGKQELTKQEHVRRLQEDLRNGKKRPCCWPGCPHRRPTAAKWFHKKKS
jgi:uncharacterized protein YdeI (YjbR/CyaY-like superfamily)